jgi:exopolysaccharide biosynthesis protein PssK
MSIRSEPTTDDAVLARLRGAVDGALHDVLADTREVAVLQFPNNGNVGNHMMWLAISKFLASNHIRLAYAAHATNFRVDDLRHAVGRSPILFLGGVTFSRLWPSHAEAKQTVASAFPANRLVSLPSTIMFVDAEDEREVSMVFGAHERVIVMARDPESGVNARRALPDHIEVRVVHDSAFRLPRQTRRGAATTPVIWQARDDLEGSGETVPTETASFDWPLLRMTGRAPYLGVRVGGAAARLRSSAVGQRVANAVTSSAYEFASAGIVRYGNRVLDEGSVLVTDRMHPHMLAALRGQHVVLLPDRYGKNRAVYEYSTHELSTVHWASTPAEALEMANEIAEMVTR